VSFHLLPRTLSSRYGCLHVLKLLLATLNSLRIIKTKSLCPSWKPFSHASVDTHEMRLIHHDGSTFPTGTACFPFSTSRVSKIWNYLLAI
jgi:hypothetical protein